jgi:hypothetical protein
LKDTSWYLVLTMSSNVVFPTHSLTVTKQLELHQTQTAGECTTRVGANLIILQLQPTLSKHRITPGRHYPLCLWLTASAIFSFLRSFLPLCVPIITYTHGVAPARQYSASARSRVTFYEGNICTAAAAVADDARNKWLMHTLRCIFSALLLILESAGASCTHARGRWHFLRYIKVPLAFRSGKIYNVCSQVADWLAASTR